MKNKISILLLAIFAISCITREEDKLSSLDSGKPNLSEELTTPLDLDELLKGRKFDDFCADLNCIGYQMLNGAYFVNKYQDTLKVALRDSILWDNKRFISLKMHNSSGAVLNSNYFCFRTNLYSELFISQNDTFEYNVIDLRDRNKMMLPGSRVKRGSYLVGSEIHLCEEAEIVILSRSPIAKIHSHANFSNEEYVIRFLWDNDMGILGVSISYRDSIQHYYFRGEL